MSGSHVSMGFGASRFPLTGAADPFSCCAERGANHQRLRYPLKNATRLFGNPCGMVYPVCQAKQSAAGHDSLRHTNAAPICEFSKSIKSSRIREEYGKILVPLAGLEPARHRCRGILSVYHFLLLAGFCDFSRRYITKYGVNCAFYVYLRKPVFVCANTK